MIKICPICGKKMEFGPCYGYDPETYAYRAYNKKKVLTYFCTWGHLQLFKKAGLALQIRDYSDATLNRIRKQSNSKRRWVWLVKS